MRAGELAGLMERDIDFGHHVIRIQRSAWRGSLTTPKTEHSYRSIDMPPTLERMLEEWLDSSLRDKGSGLVFPNKWGGVQNMSNVRENVLVPALARAGLPRLRFHDLRHTYAAILIANGESLKYVQEMMGHSSIKITADTYAICSQRCIGMPRRGSTAPSSGNCRRLGRHKAPRAHSRARLPHVRLPTSRPRPMPRIAGRRRPA